MGGPQNSRHYCYVGTSSIKYGYVGRIIIAYPADQMG